MTSSEKLSVVGDIPYDAVDNPHRMELRRERGGKLARRSPYFLGSLIGALAVCTRGISARRGTNIRAVSHSQMNALWCYIFRAIMAKATLFPVAISVASSIRD